MKWRRCLQTHGRGDAGKQQAALPNAGHSPFFGAARGSWYTMAAQPALTSGWKLPWRSLQTCCVIRSKSVAPPAHGGPIHGSHIEGLCPLLALLSTVDNCGDRAVGPGSRVPCAMALCRSADSDTAPSTCLRTAQQSSNAVCNSFYPFRRAPGRWSAPGHWSAPGRIELSATPGTDLARLARCPSSWGGFLTYGRSL